MVAWAELPLLVDPPKADLVADMREAGAALLRHYCIGSLASVNPARNASSPTFELRGRARRRKTMSNTTEESCRRRSRPSEECSPQCRGSRTVCGGGDVPATVWDGRPTSCRSAAGLGPRCTGRLSSSLQRNLIQRGELEAAFCQG